jgi:hypothetical protein
LVDAGVDLVRLTADLFDRGRPNEELGGLTAADVDALSSLGVDAAELVDRLGVPVGDADARGTRRSRWRSRGRDEARGHLRFTIGAKAALERSLREALELGDRHIGSGHLLLGVVAVDPDVRTVLAPARRVVRDARRPGGRGARHGMTLERPVVAALRRALTT